MGHWNGGPSFLGNSLRGNDKLESIKEILSNNELDILGISEANIESNTDHSKVNIEGYSMIKSGGNISRLCVYYRSDLSVKIINRNLNNIAAIWLEIGKGNK